mgnify:CR=1
MPSVSTGSTTIPYGSTLRIGYRPYGSTSPYTYLGSFPGYDSLPYTFTLSSGTWQLEYTSICPNCSMPKYSSPETVIITV